MAGVDGEVLSLSLVSSFDQTSRYSEVSRVLLRVLVLNLLVALAKIVFGYASGAISILSDGFHSLTDAASNVVGIIGVRVANQPPDANHPYGHRKFETVAAAAVTGFLLAIFLEVLRNAFNRLTAPAESVDISTAGFVIMIVTMVINLAVVRYESNAAQRLHSEVLMADAMQTRGDVWTSFAVLAALGGVRAGFPIFDPVAALVVAGFIARAAFEVASTTGRILSDEAAMPAAAIERVVMRTEGVLGCHHIRTRGSADHVFLDLHVWLPREMPLEQAHDISHVVKDALMREYPQIVDAVIHIEPPPAGAE